MQGGTNSSEFRIPDSELEGSVELRVPSPQPSRLTPVPSDKILFPRRMLYVEAVLYVTVAAAAFGLGYLAGRGGSSAAGKDRRRRADAGAGRGQGVAGTRQRREAGRRGGRRHCLARRQVARQAAADRRPAARRSAAGQGRCHVGCAGRVRRRRGPGRCLRRLHAFCPGRRKLSHPDPFAAGDPRAGRAAGAADISRTWKSTFDDRPPISCSVAVIVG